MIRTYLVAISLILPLLIIVGYTFLYFYRGKYADYISFGMGTLSFLILLVPSSAFLIQSTYSIRKGGKGLFGTLYDYTIFAVAGLVLLGLIATHIAGPVWALFTEETGYATTPLNIVSFFVPGMGAGKFSQIMTRVLL